ncbi:MAG: hypothetical protein GY821_00535, partial [Gammaproteobacteria bacterium]|nr:hypothetical protein [Gammaproteobacteria bacterium]
MVRLARLGSPKYRVKVKEELKRLIKNLIDLGCAPYTLKSLDEQTFKTVVAYWCAQDISVESIMNKLSMLRRAFSHAYPDKTLPSNRVESALTEPTLSHHGTCDVAYRGFKLAFNKTKNFALLGLGCYSMP